MLHLEVYDRPRRTVPGSVFGYWSRAHERHPGLRSVVIYLRPGSRRTPKTRPPDSYRAVIDGRLVVDFRFEVICLWEQDAAAILASGEPGMLPLLPFAKHAAPEQVERAIRLLAAVTPTERAEYLQGSLFGFASRAFPRIDWRARILAEGRMRIPLFEQIRGEGRVEGRVEGQIAGERKVLTQLLQARLGQRAEAFADRIAGADAPLISELVLLLASVRDDAALVDGVERLLSSS